MPHLEPKPHRPVKVEQVFALCPIDLHQDEQFHRDGH